VIKISMVGDEYEVIVSRPGGSWRSPAPMTASEVLEKLSQMGCHSTDIADALYAADLGWGKRHDEEVARRRLH
jgi:hypothetical protein